MRHQSADFFMKKSGEAKGFFSVWNRQKCLIQVSPIHLNNYVMGLRPLKIVLRVVIDFSRQILTTKVDPRAVRVKTSKLIMNPMLIHKDSSADHSLLLGMCLYEVS